MTGASFSRRIFKPCGRTCKPSKENSYEDCFDCFTLFAGANIYGLWAEWVSSIHPSAAADESPVSPVPGCGQRIALCRVLFRDTGNRRTALALRLLCAACADPVGGGTLQHPGVSYN